LEKGISLYEQNTSNKLLVSGDHGQENYNEVSVMKQYAIDAGIPSNDVFMDHAGFSTYDSMYRAREVFCAKKVIIVTQAYHLPRALYVANALGLDAYGVAAESQSYAGQAYRDFRELLARNKDFIYVHCSLKPSVLGDAIPVSGDGDITNN
jgi:vancomycin permeability regulator SanA